MAQILLKGSPIQTSGDLPPLGSKAPDFVLVNQHLANQSLRDYQGKRKLLSIVPSLDTPLCSLSAKKFNERASEVPGAVIFVISADLPFAQKRACSTEGITQLISLSMMRSQDFAKDYGVLLTSGPLAGITARAIIVLDESDKVVYTELVPEITQEPDYEKALKALKG